MVLFPLQTLYFPVRFASESFPFFLSNMTRSTEIRLKAAAARHNLKHGLQEPEQAEGTVSKPGGDAAKLNSLALAGVWLEFLKVLHL